MKVIRIAMGILCVSAVYAKTPIYQVDDLVAMSLEHSPDIDMSRFDMKAAQARTSFAEGGYLPRFDLEVNAGEQYSKLQELAGNSADILRGSLGASQLLYDFGKTTGRIAGAEQEAYALEAQLQQTISDKIFMVKRIYYEILKSKSIIDVQMKNVKLQTQQLHRAKRYLQSGIKTIIDVSDAEVQLEQARLDLKNAHYALELKRAELEEALGYVPNNGAYVLYSKKLSLPHVSQDLPFVKTSLESLEKYAYIHRYILNASEHYVQGAQSHVDTSAGEYYPTFSLQGNYTEQHVDSNAIAFTPERQGQVTLNMRWNLFAGHQTDASVQEAKIGLLKASSQVQGVTLAIKRDVLESHISVRQSKDNVHLTEKIAQASLKKFEQAQKRYENELSDYVELQDAQQGYIASLSNVVKAYYDYFIAMAQLDHAIGR